MPFASSPVEVPAQPSGDPDAGLREEDEGVRRRQQMSAQQGEAPQPRVGRDVGRAGGSAAVQSLPGHGDHGVPNAA